MLSPEVAADPKVWSSQPVVITATAALIAAFISGVFNLYNNSLRRFSGQRWWELKAHRYTELFDALFDLELYMHRQIEQETGTNFYEGYMEKLLTRSEAAHLQIRRAAAIGSFVFNDRASEIVIQLRAALDDPGHNSTDLEVLEDRLSAVTKAKDKLRLIARQDLRVKGPLLSRLLRR